jgi:hypothetical protein
VSRGQRDDSLHPYSRLSRPEPLLFLPSSSSVVFTRLNGPRSRPTTFFFQCSARESNPGALNLQPGTLTTRPQRRSLKAYIRMNYKNLIIIASRTVTIKISVSYQTLLLENVTD